MDTDDGVTVRTIACGHRWRSTVSKKEKRKKEQTYWMQDCRWTRLRAAALPVRGCRRRW